jgi:hypothetical protein
MGRPIIIRFHNFPILDRMAVMVEQGQLDFEPDHWPISPHHPQTSSDDICRVQL